MRHNSRIRVSSGAFLFVIKQYGSQHFDVLHTTCFRYISLTSKYGLFHAANVFTLACYRLSLRNINVVNKAFPWIISLAMVFKQSVVLLFLDRVISISLLNLTLTFLLPSSQCCLSFGFAITLFAHFSLLFTV